MKLFLSFFLFCCGVLHQHLDQVHEQRGLEHPVQSDATVSKQISQTSPWTVFHHYGKDARVPKQAQVRVQVFMTHVPQLQP